MFICLFFIFFPIGNSNRNKLDTLDEQQQQEQNKAASLFVGSNSKSGELLPPSESNNLSSSSASFGTASARFLTPNGTVVTAQRGSTASLPCEVLSLGDGVVSFVRD